MSEQTYVYEMFTRQTALSVKYISLVYMMKTDFKTNNFCLPKYICVYITWLSEKCRKLKLTGTMKILRLENKSSSDFYGKSFLFLFFGVIILHWAILGDISSWLRQLLNLSFTSMNAETSRCHVFIINCVLLILLCFSFAVS